jgi:hypothetical protein
MSSSKDADKKPVPVSGGIWLIATSKRLITVAQRAFFNTHLITYYEDDILPFVSKIFFLKFISWVPGKTQKLCSLLTAPSANSNLSEGKDSQPPTNQWSVYTLKYYVETCLLILRGIPVVWHLNGVCSTELRSKTYKAIILQ